MSKRPERARAYVVVVFHHTVICLCFFSVFFFRIYIYIQPLHAFIGFFFSLETNHYRVLKVMKRWAGGGGGGTVYYCYST